MSSVRMCDNCRTVFSENDEDWSTFSGSQFKRDEQGRRIQVSVINDLCPDCTNRRFSPQNKAIDVGKGEEN